MRRIVWFAAGTKHPLDQQVNFLAQEFILAAGSTENSATRPGELFKPLRINRPLLTLMPWMQFAAAQIHPVGEHGRCLRPFQGCQDLVWAPCLSLN